MQIPLLHILVYGFTLWLGLFLLASDWRKPGLRYTGLGLVSYAVSIAAIALIPAEDAGQVWQLLPVMLPSVFWLGAALYLVPEVPLRPINLGSVLLLLGVGLLALIAAAFNSELARLLALGLPLVFMVGALIRVGQAFRSQLPRRPLIAALTATIFFALSTVLLLFPLEFLRREWVMLAISFDLLLLGYAVAALDAYDEGTILLRPLLRSLVTALLVCGLFVGQVLAILTLAGEPTSAWVQLLFALVTTLLIGVVFQPLLQALLDALFLGERESSLRERQQLRQVGDAMLRQDHRPDFDNMEQAEFTRLTRRALSHYGDLKRLAASPLLYLPLVDETLRQQHLEDTTLNRANALKAVLRGIIEQMKPDDPAEFSGADEWRYYNVLYFPYVAGLKPNSLRFTKEGLSPAEAEALDWFRTYVPERTLYNWQSAAAALVAEQLRPQS